MYALHNTIINKSSIGLYCAYSGPPRPGETDDSWYVSVLGSRVMSSNLDIDYIKPTSPGFQLCWGGSNGGIVRPYWQTNGWVKVRQAVTTEILGGPGEPTLGYLRMWMVALGPPARALDEARKYDGGSKEAARGTKKVQEDMSEWDELIRTGNLSYMKTQRVPYVDGDDSPDDDFNPLGTYDVTVGLRWRYVYDIKNDGTVTWLDKANNMRGSGTWSYDNNGTMTFKWTGSATKEKWFTSSKTGTCQYVGEPEYKIEWSKRFFS